MVMYTVLEQKANKDQHTTQSYNIFEVCFYKMITNRIIKFKSQNFQRNTHK